MSDEKINAFALTYGKARSAAHKADLTPLILSELERASGKEYCLYLHSILADEYKILGNHRAAEKVYRKIVEMNHDHPLDWMHYTMYLHYWSKDLQRALAAADQAVEWAWVFGDLVTKTHAARIRIALALTRYDLVEESLRALADYDPPATSHDAEVGFEQDFLARIPTGAVDAQLLENFQRQAALYARSRRPETPRTGE